MFVLPCSLTIPPSFPPTNLRGNKSFSNGSRIYIDNIASNILVLFLFLLHFSRSIEFSTRIEGEACETLMQSFYLRYDTRGLCSTRVTTFHLENLWLDDKGIIYAKITATTPRFLFLQPLGEETIEFRAAAMIMPRFSFISRCRINWWKN